MSVIRPLPAIRVQLLHGLHRGKRGTLVQWEVLPSVDGRRRCWVLVDGEMTPYCYPRDILAIAIEHQQQGAAA